MVHFEHQCVLSYLQDTQRVLIPGGLALYHHSNYPNSNFQHYGQNPHARNYMTKELFRNFTLKSGLIIKEQIVINWGNDKDLDCLSLVQKTAI
jgi:cyclopropane fatty-acyl-phospholipid synthase-like methyltransferase